MNKASPPTGVRRVITYIDGFNFYFGLRSMNWKRYYWMDYPAFSRNLVRKFDSCEVTLTRLFTSRISAPESKRINQNSFLEALAARGSIEIEYGTYREKRLQCNGCNRINYVPNEKQTDVNIAVRLIEDAINDRFDMAILISGDSDLVPSLKCLKSNFPYKQVIVAFPPKRHSRELRKLSNGQIHFAEADLRDSQMPDTVKRADGFTWTRPSGWH